MPILKSIVFCFLLLFFLKSNHAQNAFFIPNQGQVTNQNNSPVDDVLYTLVTPHYNVNFYINHFAYEIFSPHQNGVQINRVEIWPQTLSSNLSILPSKATNRTHNFYQANKHTETIKEFEKLTYKNVWNGIDIEFFIADQQLKYNYIVAPQAPNTITLEVKGAQPNTLNQEISYLNQGKTLLNERFPTCYWEGENDNLLADLNIISQNTKIQLRYPAQRTKTLIIDPIAYSEQTTSYYGGIHQDFAEDIVLNHHHEILLTGYTLSLNNIATTGAHQQFIDNVDSYIAKFDSSGNRLWATYFGGNDFERSYALAIDDNDNIILSGNTMSINGIATPGAYQNSLQSVDDNFIAKFTTNGTLSWATYFGGNNHDFISAIATDHQNNIYFTGHTASNNYPLTPDAHYATFSNTEVAYFTKISGTGQLLHSSFLGNGEGKGNAIEIYNNVIYIAGATRALTNISFLNSHQNTIGGDWDGFLMKLSASNYQPLFGTYYGGISEDKFNGMAISEGNIYLAGYTNSSAGIANNNAYQALKASYEDGMLVAFDTLGNHLWGSYYGGNGTDYLNDLSIENDNIWVVGASTSNNLSVDSSSFQQQTNGGYDILLTNFTTNGTHQWTSYKGGSSDDYANAIAINSSSSFFYCGNTGSNNNFTTTNAHQVYYGGNAFDGFLSKICQPQYPTYLSELNDTISFCMGDSVTINSINSFSNYLWSNGNTQANITIKSPGDYFLQTVDNYGCPGRSDTLTVIVFSDTVTIQNSSEFLCENDSVLLALPIGYSGHYWNNSSNLDSLYIQQTGDYWATVVDNNGCEFISDTVTIGSSVQAYSINILGSPIICSGNEVILYINSSGLANYSWSNNAQTPSVNINTPGDYWLTGTNIEGCPIYSDSVTVVVSNFQNQNVSLNLSDSVEICEGNGVQINVNEPFVSYEWQNGSTNSLFNATQEGLVYVSVVDTNGCTSRSDTVTISYFDTQEIHVNYHEPLTICEGDSLYVSTNDSLSQIEWYNGSSTQGNWVDDSLVYYTAYDLNNCLLYSDTVSISTHARFTPSISVLENPYFCNNAPVLLLAASDSSTWNTNTMNDSIFISNDGAYFYTLLDTTGCIWNSDTLTIDFIAPKPSNIVLDQQELCIGNSVILQQANNGDFITFYWNDSIYSESFSLVLDSAQTIYVSLEDLHYCHVEDSIDVIAEKCYSNTLIYPNPAKDFLKIESPNKIQHYTLYNSLGSLVDKQNINLNTFSIALHTFETGIYFIELHSSIGRETYKFEVIR
ncbi:MAG: T9SS type A sorting domain-containing protein [Flavobacteriales bacterium]|jgi:hypothetical protein|nr:T9SS type A sorting domain-containing protein [Flavobacteriales bacterium]